MKLSRFISVCIHSIFLVFFLCQSVSLLSQAQTQKPVTVKIHENLGGYLESLPVGYENNPQKKYPIIIFFHGIGEVGNGSAASLEKVAANGIPKLIKQGKFPTSFRSGGEDFSFIVISPQYVKAAGNEVYVGELIKHCLQKYRVDEERIYLTGLSMGGGVTYGYASSSRVAADQLAAALFVCPAASVSNTRSKLLADAKLPVWSTHSRGDAVVKSSISVNLVNGINANNPSPKAILTIFESNSHDAWSKTYDINYKENGLNVYEWMLQYKRGAIKPIPPVANAGVAQTITLPIDYVTLDGSKSSAQGAISSYEWTKVSGPTGGNIITSGSAKTNVTALTAGNYEFRLKVTDSKGVSATANVVITVKPALLPPVAHAGSAQTITLPVNSVHLNGMASSAPSGTIISYEWTRVSGPSVVSFSPANAVQTTVGSLSVGTYVFQLKVTDSNGKSATASVTVTVKAAPVPPQADAGENITIQLPLNHVLLDGSASRGGSGNIKQYRWSKASGPTAGTIVNGNQAATAVQQLEEGVYEFQLEVTNEHDLKATSVVVVTVKAAPVRPVANAGVDITLTLPNNIARLDAGSSIIPQGESVTYTWRKIQGDDVLIENIASAMTNVSGLKEGVYIFELLLTTTDGWVTSDSVQITVKPEIVYPVARAGDDITITLPENLIVLNGSLSVVPEGAVHTWTVVDGKEVLFDHAAQLETRVSVLQAGVYRFVLSITAHSTTSTDTITVTVKAAPVAPIAIVPATITITLPVNETLLDGSASTGNIERYRWAKVSGPEGVVIENATSASTTIKNLSEGTYTYELVVTDVNGLQGNTTTTIIVKTAPLPPVANAGSAITITLPVSEVVLDGSKSTGGSSAISRYAWTKISGPDGARMANVSNAKTSVTGLSAGTYEFRLTVEDNNGATGTASVKVTVKPQPAPPVADAGVSQTITLPLNTVTLDGSKSAAPGSIVSYTWTKTSGPAAGTITNNAGAVTTVGGLIAGTYEFQLKVVDDNNNHALAKVMVIVNPIPVRPPVANAGADIIIQLPDGSIKLDGSGSYALDGSSITSYTWTQMSGPGSVTISNAAIVAPVVEFSKPGVYVIRLAVTDSNGTTSYMDLTITVIAESIKPELPVAQTGEDRVLVLPENKTMLDGSGSYTTVGTIESYKWILISGNKTAIIANPAMDITAVSNLTEGEYLFELTITDSRGLIARDTMRITVNNAGGKPDNSVEVKIYPNPVQSAATLEVKGLAKGRTIVNIYNLIGKKMKSQEFVKGDVFSQDKVDFSALPKGIYLVEVIVDFQYRKVVQVLRY